LMVTSGGGKMLEGVGFLSFIAPIVQSNLHQFAAHPNLSPQLPKMEG
jgi:hypothetical protein